MHERIIKRIPIRDLMDLKVDFAFKQLFGSEKNQEIAIVFLNELLQRVNCNPIEKIYFKNIELGGKIREHKQSRLDILVETDAKELINIEIQFNNNYGMDKRSLYYWAELYSDQLEKVAAYKTLHPTITINIFNFNAIKESSSFHSIFRLMEWKRRLLDP